MVRMLRPANTGTQSTRYAPNPTISTRAMTANPTAFEAVDRYAVIGVGAPS